jgi:branched-chain amino acid transport system permease protein
VNADRVSLIAWILSSVLAGVAGILLAPFYPQVDAGNFTVLLVAAIAAACFGRLSSLPWTLAGGLVLGIGSNLMVGYLPTDTPTWAVITNNLRPSFPFVLLLGLLLFLPGLRQRRETADPLAACDPPPPALAASVRDASLDRVTRIVFPVFVAAFLAITFFVLTDLWRYRFTQGLVFSTIFLSITVLTGLAGQISLAQATFAAVGAFTIGQLQMRYGTDFFTALIVAAVLSAAVGALVAIPALRLGGLFLTLATIAFALMAEGVIFPLSWVGNGTQGMSISRPVLGPIDFADDRWYFLLSFVVFAICGLVVILVRKGTTGRFLAAMRGSEVAAASIGINAVRWKILVFALSAAIAGVGGAMYGGLLQQTSTSDFGFFLSFVWVVLVLTLGSRTVEGAVNAGMAFVLFPIVLGWIGDWTHVGDRTTVLQYVLFGYGAITYARHPEGIVEHQKRKSMERIQRWRARRAPSPDAPVDRAPEAPAGPAAAEGPVRIEETTVR